MRFARRVILSMLLGLLALTAGCDATIRYHRVDHHRHHRPYKRYYCEYHHRHHDHECSYHFRVRHHHRHR